MIRLRNLSTLLSVLDALVALGLAVAAVVWSNLAHTPPGELTAFLRVRVTLLNLSFAVVFSILWKQCFTVLGLYDRSVEGVRRMLARAAFGAALMTAVLALYLEARHARGPMVEIVMHFLVAAFSWEIGRTLLSSRRISLQVDEPLKVVIVGSGRLASQAWRELRLAHPRGRQLLGFVDDRDPSVMAPDLASRLIGSIDDLPAYLFRHAVDELIVAAPMRSCYDMSQRAVSIAEAAGLRVVCLRDVFALTRRDSKGAGTMFVELIARAPQGGRAQLKSASAALQAPRA